MHSSIGSCANAGPAIKMAAADNAGCKKRMEFPPNDFFVN
jgi:hypothetical protein